jgi:hypothetical protein
MDERLHARLEELRAEYRKGSDTLVSLKHQTTTVRATLLRISGAIQVLEELSAPVPSAEAPLELQRNGRIAVST